MNDKNSSHTGQKSKTKTIPKRKIHITFNLTETKSLLLTPWDCLF